MNIILRTLAKDDIKNHFESGDKELDHFFQNYASQNQFKHYIGTTYVALIENIIVGFITISATSIKIDDFDNLSKKLPKYPLPILRISRLAVDKNYQNKGIGKALLKLALRLSIEQKEKFGCIGIIVDAKENAITFYEQFGFENIDIKIGHIDTRPFLKTMYLSMNTILKC
jgi:ribosomal protein S18 acetylase RimI-like enzyme